MQYQPTLKSTGAAVQQICAVLGTIHGTIKAFGNDQVEAYKTLHYAWTRFAEKSGAPSTLIDLYRWSLKFQFVMTDASRRGTALVNDSPFISNALTEIPQVLHHINRRGQIYFLHRTQSTTGKTLFTFKMSLFGNLESQLPEGYEIHEAPNGWVFCRPKFVSAITGTEREAIERALTIHFRRGSYTTELKRRSFIVYLANTDVDDFLDRGRSLERDMQYHPAFRFDLTNNNGRNFVLKVCTGDEKWMPYAHLSDIHLQAQIEVSKLAAEIDS